MIAKGNIPDERAIRNFLSSCKMVICEQDLFYAIDLWSPYWQQIFSPAHGWIFSHFSLAASYGDTGGASFTTIQLAVGTGRSLPSDTTQQGYSALNQRPWGKFGVLYHVFPDKTGHTLTLAGGS